MSLSDDDDFDNFADFTDFASAEPTVTEVVFTSKDNNKEEEDESKSVNPSINSSSIDQCLSNESNDFPTDWTCAESNHQSKTSSESVPVDSIANRPSDTLNNRIELVFKDAFDCQSFQATSEQPVVKDLFVNNHMQSIWERLQSLDESPSLKIRWNQTHSFQKFLQALRINKNTVHMNTNVPIFASGLGLLRPIKASIVQTSTPNISNNLNLIETSTQNNPPKTKDTSTLEEANNMKHFDLNDLKNDDLHSSLKPICNGTANGIKHKEISLQTCVMPTLSDDSTASSCCSNSVSSSSSFNGNSSNNNSRTTKEQDKERLSAEASKILDELPILNFMRSNRLMFPIKEDL